MRDDVFQVIRSHYGSFTAAAKALGIGVSTLRALKNGHLKINDRMRIFLETKAKEILQKEAQQ